MPIAEFPLPSVSAGNPTPLIWYQIQPEVFQVDFIEYDDGGRDLKLQNGGGGIKSWFLFYDGLIAALAAILDAHMLTARLNNEGLSAFGFNYRDRDGTLYANVHYQKYERAQHKRIWVQSRTIQLIKFP